MTVSSGVESDIGLKHMIEQSARLCRSNDVIADWRFPCFHLTVFPVTTISGRGRMSRTTLVLLALMSRISLLLSGQLHGYGVDDILLTKHLKWLLSSTVLCIHPHT